MNCFGLEGDDKTSELSKSFMHSTTTEPTARTSKSGSKTELKEGATVGG
jgi:hypothetical protein